MQRPTYRVLSYEVAMFSLSEEKSRKTSLLKAFAGKRQAEE
jgi:hypothetical protein